jgi:hypothetical protein
MWTAYCRNGRKPNRGKSMTIRHKGLPCVLLFIVILPGIFSVGASGPSTATSADKRKKERATGGDADPDARPVLWKQPGNLESLDLFYGPGGIQAAPDLSAKFTYVKRDAKGTQKKIIVKDDKGGEWVVKFGPEARPETAATRIVWAMGYHADEDYFVKQVHIQGLKDDAVNVRFKRRHYGYKDVGNWSWENNPFVGTRELDGLKVLMLALNNWDLKYDNNKIVEKTHKKDGDDKIYYVGDLGATFGKTGSLARELGIPHQHGSKDKPDQYARQSFIDGVSDGKVRFHYKGKDRSTVEAISVDNARWIGGMLAKLSEKQLTDAFRAAGYDDSEITTLLGALRHRIQELQSVR